MSIIAFNILYKQMSAIEGESIIIEQLRVVLMIILKMDNFPLIYI